MNQDPSKPLYAGPGDAMMRIVRVEGPLALYKGLLPVYFRQALSNSRTLRISPLSDGASM